MIFFAFLAVFAVQKRLTMSFVVQASRLHVEETCGRDGHTTIGRG